MTTPNHIVAIIDDMDQYPELATELRNRILGDELSQLLTATEQNRAMIVRLAERYLQLSDSTRAIHASLAQDIAQLSDEVQDMAATIADLTHRMNSVEADIAELKAGLRLVEQQISRIEADIAELKAGLRLVEQQISRMEQQISRIEADIAELKAGQRHMQQGQDRMQTDINRIDVRMDNGFGTNYEMRVAANIGSIASRSLGLRKARVLKSVTTPRDETLVDLVDQAEDDGLISQQENDDLWLLDLIFTGRNRANGSLAYVAAEVSITGGDDDINRAVARASILATVTGETVIPAVAVSRIAEDQTRLAENKGVTVMISPSG